ncbi:glucose dehydrogenase [Actibacterium atlanticum]|uniref:Glucose dehydrogenase n=1 Tax=Actibacterium atlanticum TaxID=1461693 RepID=A0A058ZNI9_9RHOB|nr:PQQ-dependent sugar dehydrogenase [Actibacterium atlanticum]KCV82386.1 glucose dehydrogenase [Actibacterium atlanticum]
MKHLIALLLLAAPAWAQVAQDPPNVPHFKPAFEGQTRAPEAISGALETEILAEGMEHPWGIAPLPGGDYLLSDREGTLHVLATQGGLSAPIMGMPKIAVRAQGGLLDVAISPGFATDRLVYWSYAKPVGAGRTSLAVGQGELSADRAELRNVRDVFVQPNPSLSPLHYGSRLVFAPDGALFVTTGERFTDRDLAQDPKSTYGKVLRIKEGQTTIWSMGHRNIQGAALDATGQLWTVEHGPQGGDELNVIKRGANYGWPVISYGENYNGTRVGKGITQAEGMEQPIYYWDPVIAPGGMLFYDGPMFAKGDVYIASLNPGGLVRLRLKEGRVATEERLFPGYRIRDVEQAPDGALIVLVDGTGEVWRVTPK